MSFDLVIEQTLYNNLCPIQQIPHQKDRDWMSSEFLEKCRLTTLLIDLSITILICSNEMTISGLVFVQFQLNVSTLHITLPYNSAH